MVLTHRRGTCGAAETSLNERFRLTQGVVKLIIDYLSTDNGEKLVPGLFQRRITELRRYVLEHVSGFRILLV